MRQIMMVSWHNTVVERALLNVKDDLRQGAQSLIGHADDNLGVQKLVFLKQDLLSVADYNLGVQKLVFLKNKIISK